MFLFVTTQNDQSMPSFIDAAESVFGTAKTIYYTDGSAIIDTLPNNVNTIYFRDPFNQVGYDEATIKQMIDTVVKRYPDARYVDDVKTFEDVLIEDKWRQYQLVADFMPDTKLLDSADQFVEGEHIAKDRLSSRGKGIAFSANELHEDRNYIFQPLLPIAKEYRIFIVNGEAITQAATRSSKTANTKVKMLSTEELSPDLIEFSQDVFAAISQYDLVGLDVARLENNEVVLIEINRSPQFARYNEISGINLAQIMMGGRGE